MVKHYPELGMTAIPMTHSEFTKFVNPDRTICMKVKGYMCNREGNLFFVTEDELTKMTKPQEVVPFQLANKAMQERTEDGRALKTARNTSWREEYVLSILSGKYVIINRQTGEAQPYSLTPEDLSGEWVIIQ